ncbi:MAG: cytochrome [Bacillales bacterium]|jgi:mono/diheme cytochrome c family protein|nr:cytochrome [Bacillales bacterium]
MKKTIITVGLVLAIGIIGTGCGKKEQSVEELYTSKCQGCHGATLTGTAMPKSNIQGVGSRLSVDEIKNVIINGKGIMKGGMVTEEEAQQLAEYLKDK